MADENKTGDAAAGQVATGAIAEAAAQQKTGVEDSAAAEQKDAKMVPLASLEDERTKRQEAESRLQYMQQAAQIAQANPPQNQPQRAGIAGITEEEVAEAQYDPGKFLELMNRLGTSLSQGVQQQTFVGQHSDFAEIVGSVDSTGQFKPAEPLQRVLREDPTLQFALQGNPRAHQILYRLGLAEKKLMDQEAAAQSAQEFAAQQQADTQTNPMSPAAAGGGGAIEQAATYASDPTTWTEEQRAEFERRHREVMSGKLG